jgi:hypothetical protein
MGLGGSFWIPCIRCDNPRTRGWMNGAMRQCDSCGLIFNKWTKATIQDLGVSE